MMWVVSGSADGTSGCGGSWKPPGSPLALTNVLTASLLLAPKKILINKSKNDLEKKQENFKSEKNIFESKIQMQNETVDQLKNIEQKEKTISTPEVENKSVDFQIKSFKNLIDVCEKKKSLK